MSTLIERNEPDKIEAEIFSLFATKRQNYNFHLLKPFQLLFKVSSRFDLFGQHTMYHQIFIKDISFSTLSQQYQKRQYHSLLIWVGFNIYHQIFNRDNSFSTSSQQYQKRQPQHLLCIIRFQQTLVSQHFLSNIKDINLIPTLLMMWRTGMFSNRDLYLCDITEKFVFFTMKKNVSFFEGQFSDQKRCHRGCPRWWCLWQRPGFGLCRATCRLVVAPAKISLIC